MRFVRLATAALTLCACAAPPAPTDADLTIDALDAAIDAMDSPIAHADVFRDLPGGPPVQVTHEAARVTLTPGQEISGRCESWVLNNAETLYVNSVEFHATAGMHHSNWFFVPLSYYGSGGDGTWPCASRGFDESVAALQGGVLFAQSTQSTSDTQQFPDGVVVAIPPYSRIVGNVHLLNVTGMPLDVSYSLALHAIPREQVTTRLSALYLEYGPLDITPHARSSFTTSCDFATVHQTQLNRPIDFKIYYGLPHYHQLGRSMRIDVVGGPADGTPLFQTNATIGEAWGHSIVPVFDMAGATGLRLTCVFDNASANPVYYGLGSGEMCIFLAFTDSTIQWAGLAPQGGPAMRTGVVNGVSTNTSPCSNVYGLPAHQGH